MKPAIDIRELRVNRGLSVMDAASKMHVPVNTLTRAENGEHRPRPRTAFKIASFYGFKVTEIWPLDAPVNGDTPEAA